MPQIKLEPIDDSIKPNDVVWSLLHGRCVVFKVYNEPSDTKVYSIIVTTIRSNEKISFTKTGCYLEGNHPILFKDPQGVPNAPCTVILEY